MNGRVAAVGREALFVLGIMVCVPGILAVNLLKLLWRVLPVLLLLYGFTQFLVRNPEIRDWLFLHFGQGGTAAILIGGILLGMRRLMK
ncbi:hypothetical protein AB8896_22930 [Yersinia enterocolitica]|uniref:hypothetical protein n=1 Tax=Yersiniaceae TaxID=1903411 RepID=UPI003CFC491B